MLIPPTEVGLDLAFSVAFDLDLVWVVFLGLFGLFDGFELSFFSAKEEEVEIVEEEVVAVVAVVVVEEGEETDEEEEAGAVVGAPPQRWCSSSRIGFSAHQSARSRPGPPCCSST